MSQHQRFKIEKTEKKTMEQKLIESDLKYRDLFENANDAIFTCSAEGFITTANNATVIMSGCNTIDELIGTNFSDWFPPESLQQAVKNIRKYFSGEDVKQPVIYEFIQKNGEHRWAEIRSRVIKEGDKAIALHCIARDITEKSRLERELKESEANYRNLFEKANDPMYIHDANGFIFNVNQAGLDGLKCTREEFVGSNISRWLTQESFLKFQERLIKRISGEPIEQPVVIEVICKDGEHRWAEIRTRVVYENGKVNAIHGIARDITEKKRLEEKLKESEEKYRDLFENAKDAMYVVDTEGNFLKMNQVGLQALGYTKDEFIGSNISKFVTPESLKIVKERQKKRLLGELVNQTDFMEMVCKNGEHLWVEIKTRDIKDGDKTIEIHGIARDITENIILKQKLKKSNNQYKLLCHLIEGSRGGKTRAKILKYLSDKSYNANQLAEAMNMDYKTVRHHLNVLMKNGIITKKKDGSIDLYYLSKNIELDLNEFNQENKAR